MERSEIKNGFTALGRSLRHIPEDIISRAGIQNPWFTPDFIRLAGMNWADALAEDKVEKWLDEVYRPADGKCAGIIMAGNIPFVGLHDLLCVLACGKNATVKLSSSDDVLMAYAIRVLENEIPLPAGMIRTGTDMKGIDYLLATGSNNSSRYFEYYFRHVPSLIRKSRTSAAVLSSSVTDAELSLLADDIYTYFGLGCRNVTHLIFPEGFELRRFYEALDKYMDLVHHHKYYNNYMYHKSIFLMNLDKHYDNGFMIFRENRDCHAPVATLNYHYYKDSGEAVAYLQEHADQWQCIVSDLKEIKDAIPFGSTQRPGLSDYADHISVPAFLSGR